MRFYIGATHRLLGEVALSDNPAQQAAPFAAPHFEHSIDILRQIGADNELALAYAGGGSLHAEPSNLASARDDLIRALAIFQRFGTLGEPDKVLHALAELPEG